MNKKTLTLKTLKMSGNKGFALLAGVNRPVIPQHVTKLAASIEAMGVIRPVICVKVKFIDGTERMYVVDGQHLFKALCAEELEIPHIIIEVDENQHKSYECSCDNKRIMELSQDIGHRPIVFIRFNPDDYVDQEGKNVKSCWSITKQTGIIKIGNTDEWITRLKNLSNQIKYWTNPENTSEKTVEIVELYYDQNL